MSTKRVSMNKRQNEKIEQLQKEILEGKTNAERINKSHEKFGVERAYKCSEANREIVEKESCKGMVQTSDGLLFTKKSFRNSSEAQAQTTKEVQKKITEERKK